MEVWLQRAFERLEDGLQQRLPFYLQRREVRHEPLLRRWPWLAKPDKTGPFCVR